MGGVLLALASLGLAPSSVRAQNFYISNSYDGSITSSVVGFNTIPHFSDGGGNDFNPTGVAVSGGNLFVAYTPNLSGTPFIAEYNAFTGAAINTSFISGLSDPWGLAVSGNVLYVSTNDFAGNAGVQAYNMTTGAALAGFNTITGLMYPQNIAVAGNLLYVADEGAIATDASQLNGTVKVYNATTGAVVNNSLLTGLNSVQGIAVSGNNLYAAFFTGLGKSVVAEYNASTGQVINSALLGAPATGGSFFGLAIAGNTLFTAEDFTNAVDGGGVGVYDATTGAIFGTVGGLPNPEYIAADGGNYIFLNALGPNAVPDAAGKDAVIVAQGTSGSVVIAAALTNINSLTQSFTTASIIDTSPGTLRLGKTGLIAISPGSASLTIGVAPGSGIVTAGGSSANTAGTLTLQNDSLSILSVNSVIANNGTGVVSVTVRGAGLVDLYGENTYTGATTVDGSTLYIGSLGSPGVAASISSQSAISICNGGSLILDNLSEDSFANNVSNGVGGTGTLVLNWGGSNSAITGTLTDGNAGTLALTLNNFEVTTLTGAGNTYSGETKILSGALHIGAPNTPGSIGPKSAVSLSGSSRLVLVNVAGNSFANNVTNGDTSTVMLEADSSGPLTLSGALTDTPGGKLSLTQSGAGTTTLTNAGNTYSGDTTIGSGTLQIGTLTTPGSIGPASNVKINSGTLTLVNVSNGTFQNNVDESQGKNGTVIFNSIPNLTVSGDLTDSLGTISVIQSGAGTTTLTSNNCTYSGTTTVTAGTLQVGDGMTGNLLGKTDITVSGGGTFATNLADGDIFGRDVDVSTLTSKFRALQSGTNTLVGTIMGSGMFIQAGSGTTILTDNNDSYSGATNITAGTLQIGDGIMGNLTATSSITVSGTGALAIDLADQATFTRNVVLSTPITSSLRTIQSGTNTLSGTITGTGVFMQNGSGTTILTNSGDSFTGPTTVNTGTLQVGNGTSGNLTGTSGVTVNNDGSLALDLGTASATFSPSVKLNSATASLNAIQAGTTTLSGAISGTGLLAQTGGGTTVLTNAGNTYSGATTVSGGILQIGSANVSGSIGPASAVVMGSATLALLNVSNGIFANSVDESLGKMGTLIFNSKSNLTINGALTNSAGTLTVIQSGGGITTLTSDNSTYNGPTTVTAGTLQVGNGTSGNLLGTTTITVSGSATFATNLADGGTFVPPVDLSTVTSKFKTSQSGTNTLSSTITGMGAFFQKGSGTTILTDDNDSYAGATSVTAGTLQVGDGTSGNLTATSSITVSAGAFLATNLADTAVFTRNVILGGPTARFTARQSGTNTISGTITGMGGFTQNGGGTTILTNNGDSFTGPTTVNTGTLQIGDGTSGNLTGTSGVTVNADGTLILNLAGSTALFSKNINLNGATTSLDTVQAGITTLSGVISGTGIVAQTGNGTTILTNANNINTGPTMVSNGSLDVGQGTAAGSIGPASAVSVSTGATLRLVNVFQNAFRNNVENGTGGIGTLNAASTFTITISGALTDGSAGQLALTQSGTGTTILTNASNDYSGATTVTGGILQLGTVAAPGSIGSSSAVSVGLLAPNVIGGTLKIVNVVNGAFASDVTNGIGGAGRVEVTSAVTNILSGALTDGGVGLLGLTQDGTGTTILTSPGNTYSGATGITAGVLQIGTTSTSGSIGAGAITVLTGGTLDLQLIAGSTLPNAVTGTGILQIDSADINTLSGVLSGALVFKQIGTGTTILTNAGNTYTGATTISDGTLQIGTSVAAGSIGAKSAVSVSNGGTLDLVNVANNVFPNNVTNGVTGTGLLLIDSTNTNTLSGAFTDGTAGKLALTQKGSGTTILTGSKNTYSGATIVKGGVLQVGAGTMAGTMGANTAVTVGNGGTLSLVNVTGNVFSKNVTNGIGGTGTLQVNSANTNTLSGVLTDGVTDTLALTQSGAGTTILTNAGNTYSGPTTVSGGVLQVGSSVTVPGSIGANSPISIGTGGTLTLVNFGSNTFASNVTNDRGGTGTLKVNEGGTVFLVGTLSNSMGNLGMTQAGTGTTILTGSNTYSGVTNVLSGTLQFGNGALGNISGTGTLALDLPATQVFGLFINLNATGTALKAIQSGTTTLSGVIAGSGAVNQNGTGTTVLNNTETYTGATNVNAGTLEVDGSLAVASKVTITGTGTLTGTGVIGGSATLTGGGAINFSAGGKIAGTLAVTGGNWNSLGSVTGVVTSSNGVFTIGPGANLTATGGLSVTGGSLAGKGTITGNVNYTSGTNSTFGGVIAGTSTLTMNHTGTTLTLTGTETNTGATTVSGGTLQVGDGVTAGTSLGAAIPTVSGTGALAIDLAGGETFSRNVSLTATGATVRAVQTGTNTISGVISGTGGFAQTGTGTTILKAANTYTGATTVSAGNLQMDGSLAGSIVTVAAGGTVSGTGTLGGTVNVSAGGILHPGDLSGPGTITLGNLVLVAGSNSNFRLAAPGTTGGGINDLVSVTGNLTLAGNINIAQLAGFSVGSYTLFAYGGKLTSSGIGVINGTGGYITTLSTGTAHQVNLIISGTANTQYWDGTGAANNNAISGGTGIWNASNANWTDSAGATNAAWSGGTAVFGTTGGTVTVGAPVNVQGMIFGVTGYTLSGNSAINLVGTAMAAPAVSVSNAGTTATIAAPLTGNAGVNMNGSGSLILTSQSNTFTGPIGITNGTVQVGSGSTMGSFGSGLVTIGSSGQLVISNVKGNVLPNAVTSATGNGTVVVNSTLANTLSGVLSDGAAGQLALTQSGTGTTTLTNSASSYSGATTVSKGTLQLGSTTAAGSLGASTVAVGLGAVLAVTNPAGNLLANNISNPLGGAGTVNVNSTATNTLSGKLTDGGNPLSVTQSGTGKTILTGTNSYTGATTITAGTLQVGDGATAGATLGTGSVSTATAGTLATNLAAGETFARAVANAGHIIATGTSNNYNIAGPISGAGNFIKTGSNAVALTGANTYTGGTIVSGGTLLATNTTGSATGSGAVTINTGGVLGGNGTVGAVALNSGGVLFPGAGTPGVGSTLHATSLMWNTGGTLSLQLGAAGDELVLTGALTKGTAGTYTVNIVDTGLSATTYTLATFSSSTFAATDFTLSLPAGDHGTLVKTTTSLTLNITSVHIDSPAHQSASTTSGLENGDSFAITPAPEPAGATLLAFGGTAILASWRRRRQGKN